MVRFTTPDGGDVWVRPASVEMVHAVHIVRDAVKEGPPKSATKIIFAGGFQYVREPVDKVLAAIGE